MICAANHRSDGNNRRFATSFLSGILLLTVAIQAIASNPPQPANATTFSNPINLSESEEISTNPSITTVGDRVYVLWQDLCVGTADLICDIFFRKSTDGGETFDDVINLSNNEGQSGIELQLAAFSKNVFVTWRDLSSGGDTALFRASTDRGATFDDAIDLGEEVGISFMGQIVVASGNRIYGIGGGPEFPPDVVLVRSTDGGKTFDSTGLSDITISAVPLSDHVRIAVSGSSRISLVYEDPSGLLFRQSNDGGETFDDAITLIDSEGNPSIPRLALSGNSVFVVWQGDRLGNLEIFFAHNS